MYFAVAVDSGLNNETDKNLCTDLLATEKYISSTYNTTIFSSDLQRAYKTAEKICQVKEKAHSDKLELIKKKDLREMDFGNWEGLTYQDIVRKYPQIIEKWSQDPTSVDPDEGESLAEFQTRIVKIFNEIIMKEMKENILIVTHGGVIRVYLAYLLGMPLRYYWRIAAGNCSVSIFKYDA